MVATLALLLATQAAVPQRTEIPLASFSAPNAFFACMETGIPSIGIDYDEMHREMDFNQSDNPSTRFSLSDPVKSVVYEGDQSAGRWIIRAEGPARNATGRVSNGTPVQVELTVDRNGRADFTIQAGSFRQTSTGCMRAPNRPRPGHEWRSSTGQGQSQ